MLAILWKDLRIELRTKETLAALLLLGLLTLVVLSFAFDPTSPLREAAAPGVLWVAVTFAGTLGMNRSLLLEREHDCLQGLLLAPVDRGSIYLAKTAANFLFMATAQLVLVPLFVFFFNLPFWQTITRITPVLLLWPARLRRLSARRSPPSRCARARARSCCRCSCCRSPRRCSSAASRRAPR
jgi:heme exporter protein B